MTHNADTMKELERLALDSMTAYHDSQPGLRTCNIILASGTKVRLVMDPQLFVIERAADGAFIDWYGPVRSQDDVRMHTDIVEYHEQWTYKDGRTATVEAWTEVDLWNLGHDEKVEVHS